MVSGESYKPDMVLLNRKDMRNIVFLVEFRSGSALVRSSSGECEFIFWQGCLLVRSSSNEVIFRCGHLPVRLSSFDVLIILIVDFQYCFVPSFKQAFHSFTRLRAALI